MTDYPLVKKVAWRYLRTALGAMCAILAVQVVQKDFKFDQALVSALIAGAVAAVFKSLRDEIGDPSSPNPINKFPL